MPVLGTLNDIKQGMTLLYSGEPYKVLIANFVRMQQRKPVMQTKMRNLITGKVVEYSFKPGERIETADVGKKKVSFLYAAGNEYVFMDSGNYEQISMDQEKIGEQANFLREGCEANLILFNDLAINVELPNKMDFKVVSTPEAVKGDTAQGKVLKMAEIETGHSIGVPMFIKEGDIVRINTETGEYVERVTE